MSMPLEAWRIVARHISRTLLVGATVLLALGLAGIWPAMRQAANLQAEIGELRLLLQRQATLSPLHELLVAQQQRGLPEALPLPAPASLAVAELAQLPTQLEQLAVEHGLGLVSVTPRLAERPGGSRAIRVHLHVRGEYRQLRALLRTIAGQPAVDLLEVVHLATTTEGLELRLTYWLRNA